MELKGKKIAFLGDSITEGCGIAHVRDTYWNRIGEYTGALVFGYGISGTRIASQRVYREPIDDLHFHTRVGEMTPDAEVIVVFGGTNDFGYGDAPLGTMTDRTDETFCGAYHLLIEKLIHRYPDGRILILTPTHRLGEEDTARNGHDLRDYVLAIRRIAEHYGLPVVDLFAHCPIQPAVEIHRVKYMPDGLHPNEAGHELIAQLVLTALRAL
jgi:lysophospholipase L1-like esterase